MKIVCIGEALIDMICVDTGTTLEEGTNFMARPGGAPANVAAVIAALGGAVELAAKVGADAFGKKLVTVLQGFGVSDQWILQSPEQFTTMAFVSLMKDGERDFVFNRGADGQLTKEETDRIPLDKVSIVHFGSATAFLPGPLQEAYSSLLEKAKNQKLFISFDPNYRNLLYKDRQTEFIKQCRPFLEAAGFFKMSDEEAMLISGEHTIEGAVAYLRQQYQGVFAITIGKEGALLRVGEDLITVPGIPVKPVDTTGAGDAFVGTVLYELAKLDDINVLSKAEWIRIVTEANKMGAITCQHFGAMEAFAQLKKKT